MKKINTILFDLDGTLIDSNELIIKSFDETMKQYMPQKKFTREDLIEMIGPPLKETFRVATDNPKIIQEMIAYYRKVYITLEFEYIKIYPNTIDMLKELKTRGFNLGIVTTKFKKSAMPSIIHYGLDKFMTSYCFLDDISEHKPHPEPIFFALKQFNNYQKVVMVGDNTSDILAGKNAACLTCGLEWSIKKQLIKALNPDFWIQNYSEFITIIENYNKEVS